MHIIWVIPFKQNKDLFYLIRNTRLDTVSDYLSLLLDFYCDKTFYRVYPFNFGDLTICVYVLYNYLEANPRVPWEDLRYLFGEIMYGGHITDDWDRRLCRTFLIEYMQAELVSRMIEFITTVLI